MVRITLDLWYKIRTLEIQKKTLIIIVIAVVSVILLIGGLVIYNLKKDSISNYKTIITATVDEGKNKWEVYKCYDSQCVFIVKNGKIQSKKAFNVAESENKAMILPDFEDLVANDVTKGKEYSKSTWEASLGESAQQLKWLDTMGYKIILKAQTQKFIEVYMKNNSNEYKRLIITNGQISVVDVDEYEFKSIDEYVY